MKATVMLTVLLAAVVSQGAVIRVPSEQPTIQAGISAASEGDTVLVAQGTYAGAGNTSLDFGNTNLALLSEGGSDQTLIDCEGTTRAIDFSGTAIDTTSLLSGFTIANGAAGLAPAVLIADSTEPKIHDCVFEYNMGGAILCSSLGRPIITDSIFRGNSASNGGAIFTYFSSPLIRDCSFIQNSASHSGGALNYESDVSQWDDCPFVVNCLFEGNASAGDGGVLNVREYIIDGPGRDDLWDCAWVSQYTASLFLNCEFAGNHAAGNGGAIFVSDEGAGIAFVRCVFRENSADHGGAVYHSAGYGSVYCGCTFFDNQASIGGAGYFRDSCPMVYCTFCFNTADSGSAVAVSMWTASDISTSRCVFAFNQGGPAIDCGEEGVRFYRCIAYGNSGGDYLCPNGTENLIANPLFCDAAARDFTVCSDSPCLPENNASGEQIGAHGLGCEDCPTAVERQTWSGVKALFR